MALSQRLELKQGQSLVMTPQLQQAIKLLQLSNLELGEYVEGELERNPLLERDEAEPGPSDGEASDGGDALGDAPLSETLAREDFSTAADLDAGSDDMYTDETRTEKLASATASTASPLTDWTRTGQGGRPEGDDSFEENVAGETTLKEHLEDQLAIAALPPDDRLIALVLIESVDEAGYLRADLTEIADRLGCVAGRLRSDAREIAGLRSDRRVRARPCRMSCACS